MELTNEMLNCMRQHYTIVNGWPLECQGCKVQVNDEVITRNGICTVFLDCSEWLNEQKQSE